METVVMAWNHRLRSWKTFVIFTPASCLAVAILCLFPQTTPALTINLTFDSDASDSPTFDSTGTLLAAIMQASADYWEDIIHDTWTLDINYYYDDLSDGNGTLASHGNLATSGGKPTEARIRFDTQLNGSERNWYFDPTPTNHSEYDLQQTLYRDLSATNQTNWFTGSPPDLLEVGYRGGLSDTAPAAATGAYDIFSTAIHEFGHAVGLTGNVSSGEYADGDYDVPTNLVGGAVMGIQGNAHIDPTVALMCSGCGATNLRRIPTATDVFAAATGAGWTDLDLYRQDMWSAGDMNDQAEWEGNSIPGSGDDAYVRHGGTGTMSGDLHFQNLTIAEDSWVQTAAHTLEVDNDTVLERDSSSTTQLFVQSGGTLQSEDLRLFGAELDLSDGTVQISDFFEIQPDDEDATNWDGQLTGHGIVEVGGQLENDGIIRPDGGALTFRSTATDAWDLDGDDGTGELDASNGDIIFESGGLRDDHDGTITIGDGHFVRFDFDWELGSGGDLVLNGTDAAAAELQGAVTATITGDITATGRAELDTGLVFNSSADISLADADTTLELGKQVTDLITYNGGDFTGPGTLSQDGDATVTSGSTVDILVSTFDFDGSTASDTTIESGATMNIQSDALLDSYSSDLTVEGTLNMDLATSTSWFLNGNLTVQGAGEVNGVELNLTGTLTTALGGGIVNAPLDIHSAATLAVPGASDLLTLNGQTTWNGPSSVTGSGEIIQNGNATFTVDTTVAVATYNMDGAGSSVITIDPGVTVTLDVETIDAGTGGFDGTLNLNSSQIAVNTTGAWSMEGTANLDTTSDTSRISGSQIILVDTLNATGGGDAHIDSDAVIKTTASLVAASDTVLSINGTTSLEGGSFSTDPATTWLPATRVELNGFTNYDGGAITVTGVLRQDGDAAVNAATTIDGDHFDMDGSAGIDSDWTLNSDLTLNVKGIEDSTTNNTFNGTLNINNPAKLTVSTEDGSWTMDGTMHLDQNGGSNQYLVLGDDVNVSGQVTVTGETAIHAPVHISGTVTLGDAGDLLQLGGPDNTLSGGTILGPGRLVAAGTSVNNSLTGSGTISTNIEFSGSDTDLLADGGTLSVSGTIVDVDDIGTASGAGTLDIVNAWNTSVAGQLQLNGGEVTGGGIINDGTTIGHGLVSSSSFVNNSTLTADGGTLTLNTGSFPDLDGSSETGSINALDGSVEVLNAATGNFVFNGALNVGLGQVFRSSARGLTNDGVVNLTNGTVAVADFSQDAQLNVSSGGASRLEAANIDFAWSSVSTVEDDLELMGSTDIYAGAVFAGSGQLMVPVGAVLNLKDGSLVGVGIENNGQVAVGSSPGQAKVGGDYSQSAGSLLEMEIEGTTLGPEYDQLFVTGTANLDGTLNVPVNPGGGSYTDPAVRGDSDSFLLVEASNRAGTFSAVHYDGSLLAAEFTSGDNFRDHVGLGLFRSVTYTNTNVELQNLNARYGDTDGDQDVDLQDYSTLARNFAPAGCVGPCDWVDGDFDNDNDIDLGDYNSLATNFSPAGYFFASAVPEPTAACLFLLGIFFVAATRGRRGPHQR
jgi:hypothetical protein